MVRYLKWETYSGPISFEVQRNDIWTDNIQSFEMPFQQHWELEMITENQLGEIQILTNWKTLFLQEEQTQ